MIFTNARSINKSISANNQNVVICQKQMGALFCFLCVFIFAFAFVNPYGERNFKRDIMKLPEFRIIFILH